MSERIDALYEHAQDHLSAEADVCTDATTLMALIEAYRACVDWDDARKAREAYPVRFGASPHTDPKMQELTAQARRANERIRTAIEKVEGLR